MQARADAKAGGISAKKARALALRRNFLLGLLHDNPNAQTVLNFQEGVLDAIRDTNFALVVRPVNRHSPNMLDDIRDFLEKQRLYGVFILPPISENEELAALCRELDCAYVRMGSTQLDSPQYLVDHLPVPVLDDAHQERRAVEKRPQQPTPALGLVALLGGRGEHAVQRERHAQHVGRRELVPDRRRAQPERHLRRHQHSRIS